MDIEKVRARVFKHKSGLPAVTLTTDEYVTLTNCTSIVLWNEFAKAAYESANLDAREFKAIIYGIGILTPGDSEQERGLRFIAGGLL